MLSIAAAIFFGIIAWIIPALFVVVPTAVVAVWQDRATGIRMERDDCRSRDNLRNVVFAPPDLPDPS